MIELANILRHVEKRGASSAHLRTGEVPYLRLRGMMVRLDSHRLRNEDIDDLLALVLSKDQAQEYENRGELDFLYRAETSSYRVNLFRMVGGQGLIFRRMNKTLPTLEELGLPDYFEEYLRMRRGLILFSGPLGGGKVTTIAAMLNHACIRRPLHIVTVENPIHYHFDEELCMTQQLEVGLNVDTFAQGVDLARAVSPDVVMVGEIPDRDTVDAVLRAADSGILVLAVMDAGSVMQAVTKMDEYFPPREKQNFRASFSDSMKAVICEHLVHRQFGADSVPVFEILVNTPAIRTAIVKGDYSRFRELMEMGRGMGLSTLDDALYELLSSEVLDISDVLHLATNKARFEPFLETGR